LISIISVFNAVAPLRQWLQSCPAQQGAGLNVIVINGGSTDVSGDINRGYADRVNWWVGARGIGSTEPGKRARRAPATPGSRSSAQTTPGPRPTRWVT